MTRLAVLVLWAGAATLILAPASTQGSDSLAVSAECEAHSSAEVSRCLSEGHRFIAAYVKRQLEARNEKRSKSYDQCRSYKKFDDCIKPIVANCSNVKHALSRHWLPVISMMTSYCGVGVDIVEESRRAVSCLEQEYMSVFSYQCDQYYQFNVQQGTRHICHFVHERVHCKEALIASACGPEVGLFSFHLFKLHSDQELADMGIGKCHVTKDANYGGLRYDTQNCPRDMVARIDECSNTHLTDDKIVDFRDESDLIVLKEDRRRLKKACSNLADYKECIKPINEACPHGAKTIFEYAELLKQYLLKMELICHPSVLEVYQKNVKCMNGAVLDSGSLSECDPLWEDLARVKENVTAFQFYCDSSHPNARSLMEQLHNMRMCYRRVFEDKCPNTGDLIEKMLQKVLQDPLYLRYKFEPDCHLHKTDSAMNDAAMPSVAQNGGPEKGTPTEAYYSKETSARTPSTTTRARHKEALIPGTTAKTKTKPEVLSSKNCARSQAFEQSFIFGCMLLVWCVLRT